MSHAEVTYRAVQAVSPGKLELTRKPLLENAAAAYARMMAGKARLRMVLTMKP